MCGKSIRAGPAVKSVSVEDSANPVRIERWAAHSSRTEDDLGMLARVLHVCVHAGASVSFILPFSRDDANSFWRDQILPAVNTGNRLVLLARLEGQIVGTVQLDLATPPNQPHRAEVKKLLVHPDARRCGIARSLMAALESQARELRRTLLMLDTVTGGPAEKLYLSLGYLVVGVVPGYALNFDSTKFESTTVMYKEIGNRSGLT